MVGGAGRLCPKAHDVIPDLAIVAAAVLGSGIIGAVIVLLARARAPVLAAAPVGYVPTPVDIARIQRLLTVADDMDLLVIKVGGIESQLKDLHVDVRLLKRRAGDPEPTDPGRRRGT